MFKLILIAVLSVTGFANAQDPGPAKPTPTTPDVNTTGLTIERPATPEDSINGGLKIIRNSTGLRGGPVGQVNTGLYNLLTTGAGVTSHEWGMISELRNYATAGENVAAYLQANKFSSGATWGAVVELADTVGAGGIAASLEVDNWTSGPDDGNRIGVEIVVGDAKYIRNLGGPNLAHASYGLRIVSSSGTPWARWSNGMLVKDFTNSGIVIGGEGTRGIQFTGKQIVGVDFSDGDFQTAVRLKPHQQVCFDNYDTFCVKANGAQELEFTYGGQQTMRLTAGGHLYLKGQVWQNQP